MRKTQALACSGTIIRLLMVSVKGFLIHSRHVQIFARARVEKSLTLISSSSSLLAASLALDGSCSTDVPNNSFWCQDVVATTGGAFLAMTDGFGALLVGASAASCAGFGAGLEGRMIGARRLEVVPVERCFNP